MKRAQKGACTETVPMHRLKDIKVKRLGSNIAVTVICYVCHHLVPWNQFFRHYSFHCDPLEYGTSNMNISQGSVTIKLVYPV